MVTAESTDRVDNLIHFQQRYAVRLPVQFAQVCFYLLVVVWIALDVGVPNF